jgi:glycosyltransferase involved in cell wall biosynthesis
MKKLAIVTTHPIQYNAPFFKMLHDRSNINIKVFYTWSQSELEKKFDPGFGMEIEWDIPLLQGYNYSFVNNVSTMPGSHHFKGINNPTLINEIQNWKPDAILVYGWNFISHLKVLRFFKGRIPVLFRGDSTLLNEKKSIKKYARRIFLKYVYSFVDIALYAGLANKAYFLAHGIKDNNLFFMPHAIDNDRFCRNVKNEECGLELRKNLLIKKNALVFLFAAKLDKNKNASLLIDAFLNLKENDAYLVIAGNGIEEHSLKLRYAQKKNIRFIAFQNQNKMPNLYAMCDVFTLPSKSETWGLSVNEAMACGKAIIISNTCGASYDLIEHGLNGFVFKNDDIDSLKAFLQIFIENRKLVQSMGQRSAEIVKKYSYENDCIVLENIFSSI